MFLGRSGEYFKQLVSRMENEIGYLRGELASKDKRIIELEQAIMRFTGVIRDSDAVASHATAGREINKARNWKEQRAMLEDKFRPKERSDLEAHWRAAAEASAAELKTANDAGASLEDKLDAG